jgi:hypothetical protein
MCLKAGSSTTALKDVQCLKAGSSTTALKDVQCVKAGSSTAELKNVVREGRLFNDGLEGCAVSEGRFFDG